jgi:hypothetical protein
LLCRRRLLLRRLGWRLRGRSGDVALRADGAAAAEAARFHFAGDENSAKYENCRCEKPLAHDSFLRVMNAIKNGTRDESQPLRQQG